MDWLDILKWVLIGVGAVAVLGGLGTWTLSWFLTHPD